MEDKNLVLALSSQERIAVLKKGNISYTDDLKAVYEQWLDRKSLVKEEQLEEILAYKDYSKAVFALGIKPLAETEVEPLYEFLQTQRWYRIHQEIMSQVTAGTDENEFEVFLRPYEAWLTEQAVEVVKLAELTVETAVLEKLAASLTAEVLSISLKTLVYDLDEFLTEKRVADKQQYFEERFENKAGYQAFFNDYPVLARLLATRADYFVKNIQIFLGALREITAAEWRRFEVKLPLVLQDLTLAKGDSHEQGKSVILFTVNAKKLVFKYKNLVVANRFDQFCQMLQQLDDRFTFYYSQRVAKTTYTIEEFVPYKPCRSRAEVQLFYRRFGHLTALMYFLRGSDFHLENLIAAGSYPVLIDVETLIQNVGNQQESGRALTQYRRRYQGSVMGTCLLPDFHKQEKKQLELSALNGAEQELPEKVLQLVEETDGRLRMAYQNGIMEGAANVPMLREERVDWLLYREEIVTGFCEMYRFFMTHKAQLLQLAEELFANVLVRNVLKATQKYAEMLDYGHHPSYLTNYLHREKLFENLWGYPYENKVIILDEIEDLLVNDVPVFYNRSNGRELATSNKTVFNTFYEGNGLALVLEGIIQASEADLQKQKNCMVLALNSYTGGNTQVLLSVEAPNPLAAAAVVEDLIQRQLIWGTAKQDVLLQNYYLEDASHWLRGAMSFNFYDGYSGLYVFYAAVPKSSTQHKILAALEQLIPKQFAAIDGIEQYTHYLGILYLLAHKIKGTKSSKDKNQALMLLSVIQDYYRKTDFSNQWLFGRASLLQICLTLYHVMPAKVLFGLLQEVLHDIQLETMADAGFAHGYAGVVYALVAAAEVFPNDQQLAAKVKLFVKALLAEEPLELQAASWCNGLTGVAFALDKLRSNTQFKELISQTVYEALIGKILVNLYHDSDGLCHGNAGILAYLNTAQNDLELSAAVKQQIQEVRGLLISELSAACYVQGLAGEPSCDLMNGLAGVGYELLRSNEQQLPNVLLLA